MSVFFPEHMSCLTWPGYPGEPSKSTVPRRASAYKFPGLLPGYDDSEPTLVNCTIAANTADFGAALACESNPHRDSSTVTILNSILWNGTDQIWNNDDSTIIIYYSDVQGGWPGTGNQDEDPLFAAGPGGCYYLSQTAAGHPFNSPCVNRGNQLRELLELDTRTTRRDEVGDEAIVDMGYHYPITGEVYLPGDINVDGVRDLVDYGAFAPAMTGPGPWPPGTITGCLTAADLDDDGDIDLQDFAGLQISLVSDLPPPGDSGGH
jgi:hypothetical protein